MKNKMERYMIFMLIFVFSFILLIPLQSFAKDKEGHITDCTVCHSLSRTEAAELLKPLNVVVKDIQHSLLSGLFEVSAERNGQSGLIFIDYAKKYVMQGVMVKIDELKNVDQKNITGIKEVDKNRVSSLLKMNSLVLGNPKATREIFVFTDPDCQFCSKMHSELNKLIDDMDIAVYVKFYPLPIHPDAYRKAQVILGRNSLALLNKAFAGESIPDPLDSDKREPIDETIELAKALGIKGTPAILLPNGKIEVGYRDITSLKKLISSNP